MMLDFEDVSESIVVVSPSYSEYILSPREQFRSIILDAVLWQDLGEPLLEMGKEIDQLNIEIKNKLKDFKGKKLVVFHPSLTYYARDYGLEQFSLETGGKEPTPQHMAKVVEMAKAENINVIYVQNEFDKENARVFAEEIDGDIIEFRPLDIAWVENLREMTQIFADNF